jgi:hypothetical protein
MTSDSSGSGDALDRAAFRRKLEQMPAAERFRLMLEDPDLRTLEDFNISDWLNGERYDGITPRTDNYRPGPTTWGKDPRRAQGTQRARSRRAWEKNVQFFNERVYPDLASFLTAAQLFDIYKATLNQDALIRSRYRKWSDGTRSSWLPAGDPNEEKAKLLGAAIVEGWQEGLQREPEDGQAT